MKDKDYSLYYALVDSRKAPVNDRFSLIYGEEHLLSHISSCAAFLDLFVSIKNDVPLPLYVLVQDFVKATHAVDICMDEFKEKHAGTHVDESTLQLFREQVLPLLDRTAEYIARLNEMQSDLPNTIPEINIIEQLSRADASCSEYRFIVDGLTAKELDFPGYIADWLAIEDDVCRRAEQNDITVLPALLKAAQNPLSDIRKKAAIFLRYFDLTAVVDTVSELLHDTDESVRLMAEASLGVLKNSQA